MRIADCLEETSFTKGDYIIRQGGAGDTFYILQSGKVKVTQSKVIPFVHFRYDDACMNASKK